MFQKLLCNNILFISAPGGEKTGIGDPSMMGFLWDSLGVKSIGSDLCTAHLEFQQLT